MSDKVFSLFYFLCFIFITNLIFYIDSFAIECSKMYSNLNFATQISKESSPVDVAQTNFHLFKLRKTAEAETPMGGRVGGLTKEDFKILEEFNKGQYAKTAKILAQELRGLSHAKFLDKLNDLVLQKKCRKSITSFGNMTMEKFEFDDGTMVRYLPKGDRFRPGPTYTVEVNKDTLPDLGNSDHTAFKVNQEGLPVPKNPNDIKLPSGISTGSFEEHHYINEMMDQGHISIPPSN